jgi:hypothetical protein
LPHLIGRHPRPVNAHAGSRPEFGLLLTSFQHATSGSEATHRDRGADMGLT